MLEYAKNICKEKGMHNVILGCYNDNIGSKKTIMKNNGILVRTDTEEFKISDNWSIDLESNYYNIDLK